MHPPHLCSPSQAAPGHICTTGTGWALLQHMWSPEQKHSGDPPSWWAQFVRMLQAVPPQQPRTVLKLWGPIEASALYSTANINISDWSLSPMLCPTAPMFPWGCWSISWCLIKQLHSWTSFSGMYHTSSSQPSYNWVRFRQFLGTVRDCLIFTAKWDCTTSVATCIMTEKDARLHLCSRNNERTMRKHPEWSCLCCQRNTVLAHLGVVTWAARAWTNPRRDAQRHERAQSFPRLKHWEQVYRSYIKDARFLHWWTCNQLLHPSVRVHLHFREGSGNCSCAEGDATKDTDSGVSHMALRMSELILPFTTDILWNFKIYFLRLHSIFKFVQTFDEFYLSSLAV